MITINGFLIEQSSDGISVVFPNHHRLDLFPSGGENSIMGMTAYLVTTDDCDGSGGIVDIFVNKDGSVRTA